MSERTTDMLGEALEEIEALRARADKAEGLLSSTREALAFCEKLHEDAIKKAVSQCERAEKAERERDAAADIAVVLLARVGRADAELERVKAERVWTTPEDRQG